MSKMLLTTTEAVELIKYTARRERARTCLHVSMDAPVVGKPDHVFRAGCGGYVRLPRSEALRLVGMLLSPELEARGGRIPVSRQEDNGLGRVCYWIG